MNVWDIMIHMVAHAWYPVNYFRLSFGNSESLYRAILTLQRENQIPINMRIPDLITLLEQLVQRPEIRKQLNFLQQNVPFRFLRPWINTSDDREMVLRSQTYENGCLYRLERIRYSVGRTESRMADLSARKLRHFDFLCLLGTDELFAEPQSECAQHFR